MVSPLGVTGQGRVCVDGCGQGVCGCTQQITEQFFFFEKKDFLCLFILFFFSHAFFTLVSRTGNNGVCSAK